MTDLVEVRGGAYHDSVSLMRVSQALNAQPSVEVALVAMATELNRDLAAGLGFELPTASPSDLLVAIRGSNIDEATAELERLLTARHAVRTTSAAHRTVRTAAARNPDASIALVSVPGAHVLPEALDAIEAGLSVMIFSDNVPVEHEVLLKNRAAERGVLVMGPDCGTAIVGGVGLGFANVVRPGPVGVVAASGTGAQQLTCLLDAADVGISHVLGVGGRDMTSAVGGRSALAALAALDADPATELIVVVSKPPAPEVSEAVRLRARELTTPVLYSPADDLTTVAEKTIAVLGGKVPEWRVWPAPRSPQARSGELRGLFCGGTLRDEAAVIAEGTPHTFIDFGDDAYTRGRAHPMIDPTIRLERLAEEAADPSCGVLLLDVVLGHTADADPAATLAPALTVVAGIPVVVSLIGTADDPQGMERQALALQAAGAAVFASNAAAVRHALSLVSPASSGDR